MNYYQIQEVMKDFKKEMFLSGLFLSEATADYLESTMIRIFLGEE